MALRLRGSPAEAIWNLQDARVSLGADLLLPADAALSPFLRTLLAGIGPLQIWGLIIAAVGVRVLEGRGRREAWVAAMAAYAVLLVVGALLGGVGGS